MPDESQIPNFLNYTELIRDFCAEISHRRIEELFQVTNGK